MKTQKFILANIVIAQFCCTSLWFAGNAISTQLTETFHLPPTSLGYLTAAVQFGFIVGTLLFALITLADRFPPSKVFFACALLGSSINLGMLWGGNTLITLLLIRFATGFFLAGIYPVGMKIASDYFDKGLGKSLGYLVGALVLGTALPHLLKAYTVTLSWKWVIMSTSALAVVGGVLILVFVADGPYRKAASTLDVTAIRQIFKNHSFRKAAFGYFGHMWELYAFWAYLPVFLVGYQEYHAITFNVSLWSFLILAVGSIGCILAGNSSFKFGSKRVAATALLISGVCCLLSPLLFESNFYIFLSFLVCWGLTVIADSPLFSTLVAQHTIANQKATALTIVNCIGFSITIVSIQLLTLLSNIIPTQYLFVVLVVGPLFGLLSLQKGRTTT